MKKTKVLSILLVIMMLVSLMPTSVYANDSTGGVVTIDENFSAGELQTIIETHLSTDPATITTLNIVATIGELNNTDLAYIHNFMLSLQILNVADTITVGTVGDDFLNNHSSILSVTLPATSFGSGCFSTCANLTTAIFPNATTFGNGSFYGCSQLSTIWMPLATTFGSSAFQNCTSMTTLDASNLPAVQSFGNLSFAGCTGLITINSNTLISISSDAFLGCTSLNSVTLPNLTNMYGGGAFGNCDSITSISLPKAEQCAWFLNNCDNLTTVELLSMDTFGDGIFRSVPNPITMTLGADIPTTVSGIAFDNYDANDYDPISKSAVVKVPYGSVTAYDTQDGLEDGYWYNWNIAVSTCDLTFDSNGGSTVTTQTVTVNTAGTEPTDPTKEGLTFGGWYTDEELTTLYNFADVLMVDTTLYAKWTANVIYDGNGEEFGDAPTDATDYTEGTDVTVANNTGSLWLEHFVFNGWNTQADGDGTHYDVGATFPILQDTLLYAEWQKETYTVRYYEGTNGSFDGEESPVTEYVVYEDSPVNVPTPIADEGYEFVGWAENMPAGFSNKGGLLTTADIEALSISNSMEYIAIYEEVEEFTVIFESNGGSAVDSQTVYDGDKATEPTEPTKEGYIFNGWYSNAQTTDLWDFDTDTITADTTIYADWIVDNSGDGGNVTPDNPDVQKGNITLTLKDSNGNPLAYYPVELHSTVVTGTTNANGQVTFSDVTLENHELVVFDKEGNELGTINLNMTASDTNKTTINGNDVAISFNESAVSIDIEIIVEDDGSLSVQEVEINANPKTGATELALFIGEGSEQVDVIPILSIILLFVIGGSLIVWQEKNKLKEK